MTQLKKSTDIDFNKIKLIIWDLDDTFWNGTISEEGIVEIPKNNRLIKDATDCGIINSINSKNELETAESQLKEMGLWEYFVFPSINWENKGQRLKSQIENMALRPENVLFIDDNHFNLEEAKYYMPSLMTALPEILDDLYDFITTKEKKDTAHSRLKRYKILEEKFEESTKYETNEEFLYQNNIQVSLKEDVINQKERIHELINRTNQLNFTKKRLNEDEVESLLQNDAYKTGYVEVKDNFGEYGIVGFYALKDSHLEHFLFSCRTMGQGIEQYIYALLDFPEIDIQGEVSTELKKDFKPGWINQSKIENHQQKEDKNIKNSVKILIKGPCDLSSSEKYIKDQDLISTEYTYIDANDGKIIEGHNHSAHILGLQNYSKEDKEEIIRDCQFVDPEMLEGTFFKEEYDIIFLSTVIESSNGIYRKKNKDLYVTFPNFAKPLTDEKYWEFHINNKTGGNKFTLDYLKEFSEKYEFVGSSNEETYIARITEILSHLNKKTKLVLILGAEYPKIKGFEERSKMHKKLNDSIKAFAESRENLDIIEISEFANTEKDFTDTLNHFNAKIYFDIAQAIIEKIKQHATYEIKTHSKFRLFIDNLIQRLINFSKNHLNFNFLPKKKLKKLMNYFLLKDKGFQRKSK